MPSRVSTAPRMVRWSCPARECAPASRNRLMGSRSAGLLTHSSTSMMVRPETAAAWNSAVKVLPAASDQKSPRLLALIDAVTK